MLAGCDKLGSIFQSIDHRYLLIQTYWIKSSIFYHFLNVECLWVVVYAFISALKICLKLGCNFFILSFSLSRSLLPFYSFSSFSYFFISLVLNCTLFAVYSSFSLCSSKGINKFFSFFYYKYYFSTYFSFFICFLSNLLSSKSSLPLSWFSCSFSIVCSMEA